MISDLKRIYSVIIHPFCMNKINEWNKSSVYIQLVNTEFREVLVYGQIS